MDFAEFKRRIFDGRARDRDATLGVFERIPSSHVLAVRILREYGREMATPPASDLFAWEQAEGKGRLDRSWSSPPGAGVYVSLIRPALAHPLQTLPLTVAIALCRVLDRQLEADVRLSWPNDLMVGERKIGGILLDAASRGDDPPVAVISFGVDHTADLARFAEPRATSYMAEGGALDMVDLALDLVAAVDREIREAAERPTSEIVGEYATLSCHRDGDRLTVHNGKEALEGLFRGFDAHGFLRLEVDGRVRSVTAGDLVDAAVDSADLVASNGA